MWLVHRNAALGATWHGFASARKGEKEPLDQQEVVVAALEKRIDFNVPLGRWEQIWTTWRVRTCMSETFFSPEFRWSL